MSQSSEAYNQNKTSLIYCQFPQDIPGLTCGDDILGDNFFDAIDHNEPMMVYMANGRIHDLENLIHTPELRTTLNQGPVHIYLYEPMCSYFDNDPYAILHTKFNNGFYSEFTNNVSMGDIGSAELDSIETYVKNNGLYDVIVHTGDYNIETYYNRYTMHMSLLCDDVFFKSFAFIDNVNTDNKTEMSKKFISTNWRYTPARAVISAILCKKETHLAWYYDIDQALLDMTPWFDLRCEREVPPKFYKRLMMSLSRLNANSPWCLDFKANRALKIREAAAHHYPNSVLSNLDEFYNPVFQNRETPTLEPFYRQSFVDIVCESRYAQPTGNLSEKVLQSIHFMTPFVLVAPPHSLKYLKEFGFYTFDRWWSEDYDQEEDHIVRMEKIIDVIEYLHSLSWEEIYDIYYQMLPFLRHNYAMLSKVFKKEEEREEAPDSYEQWLSKDHGIKQG